MSKSSVLRYRAACSVILIFFSNPTPLIRLGASGIGTTLIVCSKTLSSFLYHAQYCGGRSVINMIKFHWHFFTQLTKSHDRLSVSKVNNSQACLKILFVKWLTGGVPQLLYIVRCFPGEIRFLASEMAVGCGLFEYGP